MASAAIEAGAEFDNGSALPALPQTPDTNA
jgi:hypothetical protein